MNVPVACHVELLLVFILLHTLKNRAIADTHGLYERRKILHVEMSVRASMGLTRARRVLSENLLTTERTVTTSPAVSVTTNITVYVTNIVTVLLVELVVCNFMEALSPKHKTLLQV